MKNPERRKFLIAAPAVAGLALADGALSLLPTTASAQPAKPAGGDPFALLPAGSIEDAFKALAAKPGGKVAYRDSNLSIQLGVEKEMVAKEFEWHEQRDHVFHILGGSTICELGGTPKNAHSTRPGEWLAPDSEGAKTVTLNEGDMLVVPRGTPHRRKTPVGVTMLLVSPGPPPAS